MGIHQNIWLHLLNSYLSSNVERKHSQAVEPTKKKPCSNSSYQWRFCPYIYVWLRTLACMWMWMAVLHNVPMDTTTHTHALSLLSVMEQLFQFPRVPEPNCVLWSTKIYENSFFFGVFGLIFCSVAPSVLSFSFRSRKRFPRLPKTDTLLLIGILRDWKRKRAAATAA